MRTQTLLFCTKIDWNNQKCRFFGKIRWENAFPRNYQFAWTGHKRVLEKRAKRYIILCNVSPQKALKKCFKNYQIIHSYQPPKDSHLTKVLKKWHDSFILFLHKHLSPMFIVADDAPVHCLVHEWKIDPAFIHLCWPVIHRVCTNMWHSQNLGVFCTGCPEKMPGREEIFVLFIREFLLHRPGS